MVKSVYRPASYPALGDEWLDAQDRKQQAGLLLQDLRKEAAFKQVSLASLCHVQQKTLAKLERGETAPSPEFVTRFARALALENGALVRLRWYAKVSNAAFREGNAAEPPAAPAIGERAQFIREQRNAMQFVNGLQAERPDRSR